jgi:ubiquinone/menaquinone biosynthesis C-methylase UbiE
MIPDQKAVWEKKHGSDEHEKLRDTPSSFAPIAEKYFPRGAKIVELGCGVGRESAYFAKHGFEVVASDISENAITKNKEYFTKLNVVFTVLDMQKSLPYLDSSVDVVYANLSLHYYTDKVTREIFHEIWRVLKPGGMLAFACKSIHDFHYGKG